MAPVTLRSHGVKTQVHTVAYQVLPWSRPHLIPLVFSYHTALPSSSFLSATSAVLLLFENLRNWLLSPYGLCTGCSLYTSPYDFFLEDFSWISPQWGFPGHLFNAATCALIPGSSHPFSGLHFFFCGTPQLLTYLSNIICLYILFSVYS